MKGSLILEKLNDPLLRSKWYKELVPLHKALKDLQSFNVAHTDDVNEMEYMEAAMAFIEARDNERLFFWDNFVRKGTGEVEIDND